MSAWLEGFRLDGWQNLLTGLGTLWDKGRWTAPRYSAFLDPDTLETLFYGDPWCRRICEVPVDTALRQPPEVSCDSGTWVQSDRSGGWTWEDFDPVIVQREKVEIQKKLNEIGWIDAIRRLLVFGRLWGRQGLLIGVDDGLDQASPVNVDSIRDVVYLEVIDRQDFYPKTFGQDPEAQGFGEPETWRVTRATGTPGTSSIEVHKSRILVAGGALTSRKKRMENEWADASLLQAMYSQLQKFNTDDLAVSNMMMDASQAVLKIRDFVKILAGKDKDTLRARMQIVDRGRSVSRIMPIDAELEDFTYVERTFAGVKDIMEKRQQLLAGSVGWPSTILFGREPAGLNATGEADIRGWYDTIQSDQATKYNQLLEQLVQYVAKAVDVSSPESWGISWPSLWQESPKEKADRQKTVAETDQIYMTNSVLEADEVAQARFGSGEWSDEAPQLDEELRAAMRQQDLDRLNEPEPVEPEEIPPPFEPPNGDETE